MKRQGGNQTRVGVKFHIYLCISIYTFKSTLWLWALGGERILGPFEDFTGEPGALPRGPGSSAACWLEPGWSPCSRRRDPPLTHRPWTRGRRSRTANHEKASDRGTARSRVRPGDWPTVAPPNPRERHGAALAGLLPHLSARDGGRPPPRGRAMGGDGGPGVKGRLARSPAACAGAAASPQPGVRGAGGWRPGALR